jgi:hypothetical protein
MRFKNDTSVEQGSRRNKLGMATIVALAMFAGLVGLAGAQDGPAFDCAGDATTFGSASFGTEDNGNRLLSTGPSTRDYTLSSPLAAGTYEINGVAYDGYSTREFTPAQPAEQWFGEFLAADGTLLATTGTTVDVADEVVEATWAGSLGTVTLADTATTVRIQHAAANSTDVNSVRAICVGATLVVDEVPVNSVTVNYENTEDVAMPVELDCGNALIDSATGRIVELMLDELDPGTECAITFIDGDDCEIAVTDNVAGTRFDGYVLIVVLPDSGSHDVVVDIVCASGTVDPDPDPDPDPEPPVVTTTPVAPIEPEVAAVTEVATPIDMNPSFTG